MAIYQNGQAVKRIYRDGAEVKRAYSDGEIVYQSNAFKSYNVFGNSVQNGISAPESPVQVNSTGRKEGKLILDSVGKNLLGGLSFARDLKAKVPSATINETAETVTFGASAIDGIVLFDNFKPDRQYTLIMNGWNTGANSNIANLIFSFSNNPNPQYLTFAPNNASMTAKIAQISISGRYLASLRGVWASSVSTVKYNDFGLFEGAVDLSAFEPYVGERYEISLQEPLMRLPDGAADDLFCKKVKKQVFTGSESWTASEPSYDGALTTNRAYTDPDIIGNVSTANEFCSHLPVLGRSTWDVDAQGCCQDGNRIHLRFNNDVLGITGTETSEQRTQKFKQYLSAHGVEYYARLASDESRVVSHPAIQDFGNTILSRNEIKPSGITYERHII